MAILKDLIVTGDSRVVGNNYNNSPKIAFGTCATAAGTAEKVVVIDDPTWNLQVGDVIGVKFTNTNTVGTVKLNVNGTGAIQLAYNTSRPFTGLDNWITGYANRTIFYQYDGTYWYWITAGVNLNGDTYTTAKSWTAAGTAAKIATCHDYAAQANSWIIVQMVYANTSASALTLNINNQGAKPIYINGSTSSSSNYTLPKAHYLVFYDGTNYYFRTDGKIQGSITGDAATVNGKTVGVSVPSDAKFTDTILQNILDGSQAGSVRTSESIPESSSYTLGDYSFAEGYHTRAAGERSHVEGDQNYATGRGTHSEGGDNKAIGNYSHAEGRNNTANGENSHTEGSYTTTGASASNAHVEGYHTTASENAAHAEGYYTEATSSAAHAEGYYTTARGSYSHAEGYYTESTNNSSHAEGYHTTSNGYGSHAEGNYAIAKSGHAEGDCTLAWQDGCHAEGTTDTAIISGTITAIDQENLKVTVSGISFSNNILRQLYSNNNTTFYGDQYITNTSWKGSNVYVFTLNKWVSSLAVNGNFYIKFRTMSTDVGAHAEGAGTKASSRASHAEGIGTVASAYGQHAEGKWNVANSDYLHIAGNGTADNARSNAYTLDWNGNGTYAGKVTVGADPTNNMDVATKQYVDALMSSGSNSNGTWMRIGNLQICWHSFVTRQTGTSSTWGTTYWSTSNGWTYPQAFSTAPTVTATALDNISGLFGASLNGAPTTTSVNVETYGSGNFTNTDLKVYCVAIGFWK